MMPEYTNPNPADEAGILKQIIGDRLVSVCFVIDYVRLGFDKQGSLTLLVWPDVIDSLRGVTSFGNLSYRDRLCDLITQVVTDAQVVKDETMAIIFENGNRLVVNFQDGKGLIEKAVFTCPKNQLQVW